MIGDTNKAKVIATGVLEKFEGEALPENLVQKVYIEDGEVVRVEDFEHGELVNSEQAREVD